MVTCLWGNTAWKLPRAESIKYTIDCYTRLALNAELNVCGVTEEPVNRKLTVKLCTVGDSCITSGPTFYSGDVVH